MLGARSESFDPRQQQISGWGFGQPGLEEISNSEHSQCKRDKAEGQRSYKREGQFIDLSNCRKFSGVQSGGINPIGIFVEQRGLIDEKIESKNNEPQLPAILVRPVYNSLKTQWAILPANNCLSATKYIYLVILLKRRSYAFGL